MAPRKKAMAMHRSHRKTTLVIPEKLLLRLKVAAVEDRTDVSRLPCRVAEQDLNTRKDPMKVRQ